MDDLKSEYSALTNLLNHMLIHLSYIPFQSKSKDYLSTVISWIYLISMTLWGIRYYVLLSIPADHPLVYYLCDANFMLGDARQPLNTILCAWVTTSSLCGYFLKLTQIFPPKFYQSWLNFSTILSTHHFQGAGPFKRQVIFFYFIFYFMHIITGAATFIFNLTWFFYSPRKYWIYGIIFALYHAICGYHVAYFLSGRAVMHTFHLYIFGKYFQHLRKKLSSNRREISSATLNDYFTLIRKALIEMKSVHNFHSYFAGPFCVEAFFAQVFLLNYIFFSDLLLPFKLAFFSFGTINNLSGLSIQFFAGQFVTTQVSN